MADEKKGKKASDVMKSGGITLYFILSFVIIAAYLIYLKSGIVFYIKGKIFSRKILLYLWFTINGIEMLNRGLKIKTSGGKKNYAVLISCIIMVAFGIGASSVALYEGFVHSKSSQIVELSDGNVLCLQEFGSKSKRRDTKLYIYQTKNHTAVQIGTIDETYYAADCLVKNNFSYDYDDTTRTLIMHCNYGTFGNQFVMMRPEYDTGTIDYKFQLN